MAGQWLGRFIRPKFMNYCRKFTPTPGMLCRTPSHWNHPKNAFAFFGAWWKGDFSRGEGEGHQRWRCKWLVRVRFSHPCFLLLEKNSR